jgi:hypothetical protein
MYSNKVSLLYQSLRISSSVASDTHREQGMKDRKKIRLGLRRWRVGNLQT